MIGDVVAYLVFFLVIALTYALFCLGLNLQWGFTGLFNVGVAGFVAVGAYTSAILTAPPSPERLGGFGLADRGGLGRGHARGGPRRARRRGAHAAAAPRLSRHRNVRHLGDDPAPGHEPSMTLTGGPVRDPRRAAALRRPGRRARSAATWSTSAGRRPSWPPSTSAGAAGAEPLGPRAARAARGRGGGGRARQVGDGVPPAGLRDRRDGDGACGRRLCALRRLRRAGGLPARSSRSRSGPCSWSAAPGTTAARSPARSSCGRSGAGAARPWSPCCPQALQARGAALQTVLIGVVLAARPVVRPRGLFGEETVVSPHARSSARAAGRAGGSEGRLGRRRRAPQWDGAHVVVASARGRRGRSA